jgi:peptide/nickel transport system substrate-binding protein
MDRRDSAGTPAAEFDRPTRLRRRELLKLLGAGSGVLALQVLAACAPQQAAAPAATSAPAAKAPAATAPPAAAPTQAAPAKPAAQPTEAPKPAAAQPTAAAAQPASGALASLPRGGRARLVYGGAGQPAHLDTQLSAAGLTFLTSDPVNDWLVRYDDKLQLQASLASSFEVVDDRTVRFVLRDGLKFHNGRDLTSDDVRKNIERVKDPKNSSPYGSQLAAVEGVETPDPKTAVFKLSRPYPPLMTVLTRVPILPIEAVDEMKTKPVGAGPFRFKEWKQDSYIDYERFDGYWNPEQPRLDAIRWAFLPDYNAAKNAFLAREQDLLLRLSATDFKPFEAMAGQQVKARSFESLGVAYLAMNQAKPPYDNLKVRQAIQLTLDKQAFSNVSYAGLAQPLHIPITRASSFYFDDYAYERDVAKAKQLMAEAGFANGFDDTVLIPKTPFEEQYGVVLQGQLREIGVRLQVVVMEPGPFVTRTLGDKDYTICMLGDSTLPDPAFLIDRYLRSDGGANLFNYKNPKMDELLGLASGTYDEAQRKEHYKAAMQLMIDDAVWQIVLASVAVDGWRDPPLVYDAYWSPTGNRYNWGSLAARG